MSKPYDLRFIDPAFLAGREKEIVNWHAEAWKLACAEFFKCCLDASQLEKMS